MQKALQQMNLLLHNVVSDIVGVTGLAIIRAILAGDHNPQVLAQHRDYRCKHSEAEIAKSVVGNYREEYLFALEQALTLYESYQAQIAACDARSEAYLQALPTVVEDTPPPNTKTSKPQKYRFAFDLRTYLYQFTGTDLKRIHGIDVATALTVVSEIGTDMSRWKSAKHLSPGWGFARGRKYPAARSCRVRPSRPPTVQQQHCG